MNTKYVLMMTFALLVLAFAASTILEDQVEPPTGQAGSFIRLDNGEYIPLVSETLDILEYQRERTDDVPRPEYYGE